jgi:hypothetical protein
MKINRTLSLILIVLLIGLSFQANILALSLNINEKIEKSSTNYSGISMLSKGKQILVYLDNEENIPLNYSLVIFQVPFLTFICGGCAVEDTELYINETGVAGPYSEIDFEINITKKFGLIGIDIILGELHHSSLGLVLFNRVLIFGDFSLYGAPSHPVDEPEHASVTAESTSDGRIKLILAKGGQNYDTGYDAEDVDIFVEGQKVIGLTGSWVTGEQLLIGWDGIDYIIGASEPLANGSYNVTVSIFDDLIYDGLIDII